MTFIAVPIFVNRIEQLEDALDRASRAVMAGARFVEWRIDGLADGADATNTARELVRRAPAPCIITCRPAWEGGFYTGDEQSRISLFEALATDDAQPKYLDVELRAFQISANLRQKVLLSVQHPAQPREVETGLLLSSHDFTSRPADLIQRVEAMAGYDACAVVKIAWRARSLRDNLEAFDLLTERTKPMIALCMGQFGLMSRVLAPKFGGLLTFAADEAGQETAPGQPTIEELLKLYRFDSINPQTKVYGVIGWPVSHSRSPQIHNAGFEAVGYDGVYLPLPIPPEWEHFKATVGALVDHPRLDFRGASVTLPHKEHLLRFVKERGGRIDPMAERMGAANTLIVGSAGEIACMNTDAPAAVDSLCSNMRIDRKDLAELRVAVLGAGGAARAVVAGLAEQGTSVVIFNRDRLRAEALANEFDHREAASGGSGRIVVGGPDLLQLGCFHVIINCTSIGMTDGPAPDASPLEMLSEGPVPIDDRVTVFDTVYNPRQTPLLDDALVRGARVISGLDMFIRQAAMQFKEWTGKGAPIEVFTGLLRELG